MINLTLQESLGTFLFLLTADMKKFFYRVGVQLFRCHCSGHLIQERGRYFRFCTLQTPMSHHKYKEPKGSPPFLGNSETPLPPAL